MQRNRLPDVLGILIVPGNLLSVRITIRSMLPTFPESKTILKREWEKRFFAAKTKIFPVEIHPPVMELTEGKKSDYQTDERRIRPLKVKSHSVTARHSIKDGMGMTITEFDATAVDAGEKFGNQMWELMKGAFNDAVDETGNEIEIKKGDLKKEDILRILEMGEKTFDEHGNMEGQMLCNPAFAEELRQRETEWMKDKDFQAKVAEIITRKKAEFNEREAGRRLVR